jgi:hypothetical protein
MHIRDELFIHANTYNLYRLYLYCYDEELYEASPEPNPGIFTKRTTKKYAVKRIYHRKYGHALTDKSAPFPTTREYKSSLIHIPCAISFHIIAFQSFVF